MFERFTDRARRSIVLAQEEARRLQHNYIGTEHLLLGLLDPEQGGLAARAAGRFGLTLEVGRDEVLAIIGRGKQEAPTGHIPFTPRAKKCLELTLREALQLNHDYIGSEHILLGIVREGSGVAARILMKHAGSLADVRAAVMDLLPASTTAQSRRWPRRLAGQRPGPVSLRPEHTPELRTTPAADTSLEAAARLAGPNPVGSHHILLAALTDPDTAAARALVSLGVDLDRAREALRSADVAGSSDESLEEAGRRQMTVTVTSDRVTVAAADPVIVQLGRSAVAAAGRAASSGQPPEGGEPGADGVIRGDHPLAASLGLVWQALHDSLEDVGRRAVAGEVPQADPAPPAEAAPPGAAEGDG